VTDDALLSAAASPVVVRDCSLPRSRLDVCVHQHLIILRPAISCVVVGRAGDNYPFLPLFYTIKTFSSGRHFLSKMRQLGWTSYVLGKRGGLQYEIEIASTDNLLCRKFAAVCWKIATSCNRKTF